MSLQFVHRVVVSIPSYLVTVGLSVLKVAVVYVVEWVLCCLDYAYILQLLDLEPPVGGHAL